MQDHDAVRQSRQINHTENAAAVTQAEFTNARPDRLHRLPIIWRQSTLNPVKLIASGPSRNRREIAQARERIAPELDRLHGGTLYHNGYNRQPPSARVVGYFHRRREAI